MPLRERSTENVCIICICIKKIVTQFWSNSSFPPLVFLPQIEPISQILVLHGLSITLIFLRLQRLTPRLMAGRICEILSKSPRSGCNSLEIGSICVICGSYKDGKVQYITLLFFLILSFKLYIFYCLLQRFGNRNFHFIAPSSPKAKTVIRLVSRF